MIIFLVIGGLAIYLSYFMLRGVTQVPATGGLISKYMVSFMVVLPFLAGVFLIVMREWMYLGVVGLVLLDFALLTISMARGTPARKRIQFVLFLLALVLFLWFSVIGIVNSFFGESPSVWHYIAVSVVMALIVYVPSSFLTFILNIMYGGYKNLSNNEEVENRPYNQGKFEGLVAELIEIGQDIKVPPGYADSGYFRVADTIEGRWDPRTREIGEELLEMGGNNIWLMKKANLSIKDALGTKAAHDLSAVWHRIGEGDRDYLDMVLGKVENTIGIDCWIH